MGVYTINLPRIGYLSRSKEEFKARLWKLLQIGKISLEIDSHGNQGQNEYLKCLWLQGSGYLMRSSLLQKVASPQYPDLSAQERQ